jgi:signal transduction histidine kinase
MSHDLRTPLNAIGGYAQLIELEVHGPVTGAQREALGRVRRAQEHLLTLINDILSFARLEAGQVTVTAAAVPAAPLVRELAALVQPEADARGLSLAVDPGPDGAAAWADRERLLQVLLNLTSNALKFTPAAGCGWRRRRCRRTWSCACRTPGWASPPTASRRCSTRSCRGETRRRSGRPGWGWGWRSAAS